MVATNNAIAAAIPPVNSSDETSSTTPVFFSFSSNVFIVNKRKVAFITPKINLLTTDINNNFSFYYILLYFTIFYYILVYFTIFYYILVYLLYLTIF